MFATLTFLKSKKRLCKNIRIEEKHIGDIEYLNVVCFKKINPKKIEKKLKNKVDTIILAENINNIEFKNIKVYNSDKYLKIISIYWIRIFFRIFHLN